VLQTADVRANDNMHRSDSQASARLWEDHLQLVATDGYLDQFVPAATPSNPGLTVHSITARADAPPRTPAFPSSLPAQLRTFAPCDVVVDKQTELGRGPCSIVYAGKLNEHTEVAVKVIRVGHRNTLKNVKDEFRRVNRDSHHNVVQVFGIVELPGDETVGIVMERLGVSLQKAKVSDPSTRMRYTLDIIAGMEHIHGADRSVAHFDLKPSSILLTQDGRHAKIINFLVAPTAEPLASDSAAMISSTLPFVAPELLAEEWSPSPACDVYSFAVVLAELWTGTVAWEGTLNHLIPEEVTDGRRPFSRKDLSEKGAPDPIIALIVACWAQEPERRPTFTQLSEIRTNPNFHLASQEAWPSFLRAASSGLL
jgi:serine/threonine protein kinase